MVFAFSILYFNFFPKYVASIIKINKQPNEILKIKLSLPLTQNLLNKTQCTRYLRY